MPHTNLSNCVKHNSKSTSICMKNECSTRLACPSCLMTEHQGHVDSHIIPIHKFLDSISKEFQRLINQVNLRPEMDRLQRISYSKDMIAHIESEFKYLKEKTNKILSEREQGLVKLLINQTIHQRSFVDVLDHINYMLDGKVFEEGLKVVLPMMLISGGVQESIIRLERDKIRIALKVKESINQIKSVLDGLFYVGGIKQVDQLEIKGVIGASRKDDDRYEDDLLNKIRQSAMRQSPSQQNNDKLSKSSIFQGSAMTQIKTRDFPFTNNYREFTENLYPKPDEFIDIVANYPPQRFTNQYQEIDREMKFKLFGILEHSFSAQSVIRLRSGLILTCSNQLTFWNYPQLKQIQQTAFNYGIHHVLEVLDGLLICQSNDSISTYEQKEGRWIPKGEFITPGTGNFSSICLSNKFCNQDLLCIMVDSQLMIYKLSEKNHYGQYERQLQRRPLETLVAQNHPLVYQHKHECRCVGFEHDGQRMITGDAGGRLYRWKIGNTFNAEEYIQGHNSSVEGVIPLHDGRTCSISNDGIMKLWDSKLSQQSIGVVKHRSLITKVTEYFQDVDCFFTGDIRGSKTIYSFYEEIQMWKVSVCIMPIYELDAHTDQITSIYFSPLHTQQMISSSIDKKVKIWNLSL